MIHWPLYHTATLYAITTPPRRLRHFLSIPPRYALLHFSSCRHTLEIYEPTPHAASPDEDAITLSAAGAMAYAIHAAALL